ncbi:MAG: hypothetical protein M3N57_08970, partial [Actinomycetota bacterium]|nr:hypothetical protein [Actinomycetota bacterium]
MAVATEDRERVGQATVARGVQALGELGRLLDERNHLDAAIVELVGELHASGVVEQVEGLPLDLRLAAAHHLTGAERWVLITASQVLRHLPVTAGLFNDGRLSWSRCAASSRVPGTCRSKTAACWTGASARRSMTSTVSTLISCCGRWTPRPMSWLAPAGSGPGNA